MSVDDHDQNCVIRRRALPTGPERVFSVPTSADALRQVVAEARAEAGRGGRVTWVQESTTGWARVQALLGDQVTFLLANVVQMPLPPKGRRRKTDQSDTARIQREALNGSLPLAHQPSAWWRQVRRLVGHRESLVARRTALRNWINRYLAHETWEERSNVWSAVGRRRLDRIVTRLPAPDALVVTAQAQELDRLAEALTAAEAALHAVSADCPQAQRLDALRGLGPTSAVALVARIGPVERFRSAEQVIAFAGLAPGVHQSDQTRRHGRIGGGGTDRPLRHYLIEASIWARQIPRYQATYQRTAKRRGAKMGRLVVARLLLRSIYKVLKDGVAFEPAARTADA